MYNKIFGETANKIGIFQGDIPFRRIAALPADATPHAGNIIAFGEVTGHHHVIEVVDGNAELFDDALGNLFMRVNAPVRVLHQEHGYGLFDAPGVYQIGKSGQNQVEYAGEEERRMLD